VCLIVISPKGELFPKDKFLLSAHTNDDGFGLMWVHDGKVCQFKTMEPVSQWYEYYEALEGIPHAFHHRMATHGSDSLVNVHPFRVLTREHHGQDLLMMHNGVISGTAAIGRSAKGASDSDTLCYVKEYLRPILRHDHTLLRNKNFKKLIGSHVGSYNKLAFLSSDGVFTVINRSQGHDMGSFWLSNTYSIKEYSTTNVYKHGYKWPEDENVVDFPHKSSYPKLPYLG
jgi:predicted glutamine amidotransferase